jgi:hypothetical protein
MSGMDIAILIAIILFARLGSRLVYRYFRMKKENNSNTLRKE